MGAAPEDGSAGSESAAAAFHRAAALALSDARAPGDVVETLALVRGVALRERAPEKPSSTPGRGALAALAASATLADASRSWDGFEPVGEEMLHGVAPEWLPCLTSSQRASLFDDVLRAMPPTIATRVLLPALSPGRTAAGRDLGPKHRLAIASEAAELFVRALERGLARDLVDACATASTLPSSRFDEEDVRDLLAALLSAADRCELPPGAHPAALAALHPDAYARELANQFVAAGAESLGSRAESSAKPADAAADPNGDPSGAPASARLAAFALGRICRRGNARRAADALVSRVLDADGGEKKKSGGGGSSPSGGLSLESVESASALGDLVDLIPDASAAEALCRALPFAADASGATWLAFERCLRVLLAKRFWRCPTTRRALADACLLRRASPRRVLPAIVMFALADPPEPPTVASGSEDALDAHVAATLASVVDAWSDLEAVRGGDAALRAHVAAVVALTCAAVPQDRWRRSERASAGFGVAGGSALMRGISARLDSPDARVRSHGRKVAVALSRAVDPEKPLTFRDDREFFDRGDGDDERASGSDADSIDDVSEDEAEWERDLGAAVRARERESEKIKGEREPPGEAEAEAEAGGETVVEDVAVVENGSEDGSEEGFEDGSASASDDPDAPAGVGAGARRFASDRDALRGVPPTGASDTSDSDEGSDEGSDEDSEDALRPYDDASSSDSDDDPRFEETSLRLEEKEKARRIRKGVVSTTSEKGENAREEGENARRRRDARRSRAKRLASLPRPSTLSGCVAALRQRRGGDETASSKSASDRADAAEGAVHAAEALVRAAPEELAGAAGDLVAALIHAHPPTPDEDALADARRRALRAIVAVAPTLAGPAAIGEALASGRCDAGQTLEVLDAVADAARELAALPSVAKARDRDDDDRDDRGVRRVGRERRFAPRSLARLRDGTMGRSSAASGRTRAYLVCDALGGPLLARVPALLRRAADDEKKTARSDAGGGESAHVPGSGMDAIVLGRVFGALGECCAASRNAPDAARLAAATLEAAAAARRHPLPDVRRAALFAAFGALAAVPPAAAWRAIEDASRDAGDNATGAVVGAGSALGRVLAATEAWAEEARARDPDEDARRLATRVGLAAADLEQRALQVGARRERGGDALEALKSITAEVVEAMTL